LLKTAPQLLDTVDRVLDPPSQLAHLGLHAVHPQLGVDCGCRSCAGNLGRPPAINLPLQHAEIPLQAIQPVLDRTVLCVCRWHGDRDESQNQD
jgi:hypothetical protein